MQSVYMPGYADNLVSYILLTLAFILSYQAYKRNGQVKLVVFTYMLFCIFAFWSSDTASYEWMFRQHKVSYFKEPIYYYIGLLCFDSYYIFRTLIWGTATIFFYYTVKNFKLNRSLAFFVLTYFFLMTFSYARASLAMATYLFGLSFILNNRYSKTALAKGVFFILLAPFFHRSYYVVVAITPFLFIKINKKVVLFILVLSPLFARMIQSILQVFLNSQIEFGENLENFSDSVQDYAGRHSHRQRNWKFLLVTSIHQVSYYFTIAFILYHYFKNKTNILFDNRMRKMITLTVVIAIISTIFTINGIDNYFSTIVGYRFLYMTSLPIVVVLSYMYMRKIISRRLLFLNLVLPFLYAELFFIGKLLKIPVFW